MKKYICCFTGHREMDGRHLSRLVVRLKRLMMEKYEEGVRVFRTGGAIGFDTFAALAVVDMKKKFPDVRLELFLPCRDQTAKWAAEDVRIYKNILKCADSVVYAEEQYTSGCMMKRNRMLVDGSDCCIAYYNGSRGRSGTGYTVNYARSKGIELVNLCEEGGVLFGLVD